MAWTENGPVSLPPPAVAATAGIAILICAVGGVGLGFKASERSSERPSVDTVDQSQGLDQAAIAKPIVDITAVEQQAPAANTAAPTNSTSDKSDDQSADDNDIASQTAAAQAVQGRPSKSGDIDEILTSRSEKPQAPAKPSTDEGAPPSDVPF